jgi:hypothetical protein
MQPDHVVDLIFAALGVLFKDRSVAPLVILPIFFVLAVYFWIRAFSRTRPWIRAAKKRIAVLRRAVDSSDDPIAQRQAFAEQFSDINAAMADSDSAALRRAWNEYHETIVDETLTPIRNTARPMAFFSRAVPNLQFLAFWSNVFVGLGLVLTFVGIVVALNTAAEGMKGGDVSNTQIALTALLRVASAKFFASIGALLASLMLRLVEFHFQNQIRKLAAELSDLLERGLLYVSPQLLAVQQLEELKRQSAQIERFNSDLAITIGEQVAVRFQAAVAPIAASIGSLNDSISGMANGLREGLGQGAADAVSAAASGELRALGQTLEALRLNIENIGDKVGQSGGQASEQIRAAGSDFARAASEIRDAFELLSQRVDSMGKTIAQESEVARDRQAAAIAEAVSSLNAVNAEAAQGIARAVEAIRAAGQSSADQIKDQAASAIASAAQESRTILKTSVAETGAAFAQAGRGMVDAIQESTNRMLTFANAIEKSERGAAGVAESFIATSDGARALAATMSEAAGGFQMASAPVIRASHAMQQASDKLATSLSDVANARTEALNEVRALTSGLKETSGAAELAWKDYQARFAGVDEDLRKTHELLAKTLSDTMEEFRKFAQDVDLQLAKAVNRFGDSLASIEEHSETLSDFVGSVKARGNVAAE